MNKYSTHAPYNYIQYIKITDYLWQQINMDFKIKLPKSKDVVTRISYDNILMVVDRLIKYIYFIPHKENYMGR